MAQIIRHGAEAFEEIYERLRPRHTLLVCDRSFPFLPAAVRRIYESRPDSMTVFSDFTPNPLYEQVCAGVELFRQKGCDLIVAVGGGSCLDVAKCIKLFSPMTPGKNYLQQPYADSGVPLVALPTTAGTGSESTRYAVVYFEGKKQSVTHHSLVPDYAILEPAVLQTLPLAQKKATMLDALAQGIESWWSVNSTEESRGYSRLAVETIVDAYKPYLFENSAEAAARVMLAANFAGRAINITQTTAPHAMSYKLTSLYGLPHGHAVALCLPEVWHYMTAHPEGCIDRRGTAYLQQVFEAIPVDEAWFRALLKELDMPYPTAKNRPRELDCLTGSVNPERLRNNPVALSGEVLRSMYERIVKE